MLEIFFYLLIPHYRCFLIYYFLLGPEGGRADSKVLLFCLSQMFSLYFPGYIITRSHVLKEKWFL